MFVAAVVQEVKQVARLPGCTLKGDNDLEHEVVEVHFSLLWSKYYKIELIIIIIIIISSSSSSIKIFSRFSVSFHMFHRWKKK